MSVYKLMLPHVLHTYYPVISLVYSSQAKTDLAHVLPIDTACFIVVILRLIFYMYKPIRKLLLYLQPTCNYRILCNFYAQATSNVLLDNRIFVLKMVIGCFQ